MQKTIIALRGIAKSGKTTTIKLAYDDLRKEGRCIAPNDRRCRTEVKGAILEIDGVKVGFISPGDAPGIVEENIVPLIEKGCDIIVCATHTRRRGGTVEFVERLAKESKPPFIVDWIEKAFGQADPISGNRQKADEIITAVRRAIAEAQPAEAQLVEA